MSNSDYNESTDADGNWHEEWSPVLSALGHFSPAQITHCQQDLQCRYRENGLAFGATISKRG